MLVTALVDTSSSISLIGSELFDKLGLKANLEWDLIVTSMMNKSCSLGQSFLSTHHLIIDFESKLVKNNHFAAKLQEGTDVSSKIVLEGSVKRNSAIYGLEIVSCTLLPPQEWKNAKPTQKLNLEGDTPRFQSTETDDTDLNLDLFVTSTSPSKNEDEPQGQPEEDLSGDEGPNQEESPDEPDHPYNLRSRGKIA